MTLLHCSRFTRAMLMALLVAFALYGASVFDTITGKLLGQIAISNVTSQKVLTPDKLLLTQQADGQTSLLEARLDLKGARKELAAKE